MVAVLPAPDESGYGGRRAVSVAVKHKYDTYNKNYGLITN